MGIYLTVLTLSFVFSSMNVYLTKRSQSVQFTFLLFALLLILILGLRYNVGVDYMNYEEVYESSVEGELKMKEFLLDKLFQSCRANDVPFQIIMFVFAVLTIGLAFRSVWKYSPFVFFSILIFFSFGQYYYNTFNAVRQCLAIYLFFNLLDCIKRRRWQTYFYSLLLAAFLVHASTLLLLPLYFILHKRFSFKKELILLCTFCFLKPVVIQLVNSSPYAIYLAFDNFANGVSASTYGLLLMALFFFFLDFKKIKLTTDERADAIWYNLNYLSLLSLLLVILFANSPMIMVANRFSYYFTPVYIILLPLYVARFKRLGNRLLLILTCSVAFSLICYATLSLNGRDNKLIPYQTVFDTK